jgi:tRNA-Thr(GGU) m(6)t(6)A37 methyltransferase TsaA
VGRIRKKDGKTWIEVHKEYEDGLLGLEGFSHVIVLSWFHKNDDPAKRKTLQVHPRGDKSIPLRGVFATRSPMRPNLISLNVCLILSIKGRKIEIDEIDAFDGTPVIDLKPCTSGKEGLLEVRVPEWVKRG